MFLVFLIVCELLTDLKHILRMCNIASLL